MPNPTPSDLHISAALTDISIAYSQQVVGNFAAMQVFPVVPVTKQGNKYFTYDRTDWFRSDAKGRAPGAVADESGWRVSTDSYFCDRVALAHNVDDPTRANADSAVANLDADATEYLTEQLMLKNEIDWATDFFTTGVWLGASSTSDMTGQANPASTAANFKQWNNVDSTPIEDINGEAEAIASRTGRSPNTLALGRQVFRHLKDHPDILDRIKYTERGIVTTDLLASLLDVERVIILKAVKNTAVEGSSAATYAFVAGKNALLAYVEPNPGLRRPSAGYTFVWTGGTGIPRDGSPRIKRYRYELKESDRIEAETWRDFKVVGADLGAFFSAATA